MCPLLNILFGVFVLLFCSGVRHLKRTKPDLTPVHARREGVVYLYLALKIRSAQQRISTGQK